VIVIGALLAGGLLLTGSASAAQLAPAAGPAPSMTLTASATEVLLGEAPVLTVAMPADATGTVGFYDFARPGADKGIGVAPIIDGVATLTAPDRPLVLGANPIQASYGGNEIYGPADSNIVTVTVVYQLIPTLTLTANSTLVLAGHKPTLTVHMPAAATGRVTFWLYLSGRLTLLGVALNVGGTATLTPLGNPFVVGINPIDAEYEGNARYAPNISNTVIVTVIGPTQTVAFTGSQQTVPAPLGATAVRITATGASGAGGPPCGVSRAPGGHGALAMGTVALPAGAGLIVDVGGAGNGRTGGWGGAAGGGTGGYRGGLFSGEGAGGGGATTVALSTSGVSTLMIAGAGGGAGDCGEFFADGGAGGSAGITAGNGQNASGGISPGSGGAGGAAATPAGTGGTGAGGGGGGGAAGGLGGSGDSQGAAGGGGGAGSTTFNSSLLTGVNIATASTTGNGTVTLDWLSGLSPYTP
jgi:hypothetical protein